MTRELIRFNTQSTIHHALSGRSRTLRLSPAVCAKRLNTSQNVQFTGKHGVRDACTPIYSNSPLVISEAQGGSTVMGKSIGWSGKSLGGHLANVRCTVDSGSKGQTHP